jgi:hypothetical protein
MTDTKIKIVMSLSNMPGQGNLGTGPIAEKLEGYVNEAIAKLEKNGREILNVSISMNGDSQGITNSMTAAIMHRGESEQS